MKELLILLKKNMLVSYGGIINIKALLKSKKKRRSAIFTLIGIAIVLLYAYLMLGAIFKYIDTAIQDNTFDLLCIQILFFLMIFYIIIGASLIMSKAYKSDDTKILMRLPLKIRTILIANIIDIIIGFLTINIIVLYPMLTIYGVKTNQGILFYLYGFINSISLIGIMSILIYAVCILIIAFMNKFPRLRNIIIYLGMFLFLGIVLGVNFFINFQTTENKGNYFDGMNNFINHKKDMIYTVFPQIKLFVNSILSNDLFVKTINFTILLAIFIILIFIFSLVFEKLFVFAIIGEKQAKRIIKKGENRSKSILSSLIRIEISSIIKNPTYVFNVVIPVIIFPIMIIFSIVMMNIKAPGVIDKLKSFIEISGGMNINIYYIIIGGVLGLAVGYLSSGLSCIAGTSISRHKYTLWLMQSLPINHKKQIFAKLLTSCIIVGISIPLMIGIVIYVFGFNIILILSYIISTVIGIVFGQTIGIFLDIINPKLDWTEEVKAVKSNPNAFISIILTYGVVALIGYSYYKIMSDKFMLGIDKIIFYSMIFLFIVLGIIVFITAILVIISLSLYKKKLLDY